MSGNGSRVKNVYGLSLELSAVQFSEGQRLPISFRPYVLRRLTARLLGFRGVRTLLKTRVAAP